MEASAFRYDGKRAVIVGGATGMGEATAELIKDLGGEVVVMDCAEVKTPDVKAIHVDLTDKASIDAATDECGGPIDALFPCAGIAGGENTAKVNFLGHRHMIDRAIAKGFLRSGSSIGFIASTGGYGWLDNLDTVTEFLDTPDFDAGVAWTDAHPGSTEYIFSKRAVCAYVAREAFSLAKKGIRINAILPGPTDTPLARANADTWLAAGTDYRGELGIDPSRPDQQAGPLAFLCSDAASYVTGSLLVTDFGYFGSGDTGSYEPAAMIVKMVKGRM